LGGDDFDQKIVEWLIEEFKRSEGIDLSRDVLALQRLRDAAEKAKHELSSTLEANINIPFITSDSSGPRHLDLKLSRAKLEELVFEFIDRAEQKVREVLKDAGFKIEDIDEIVLVGGQTRMPAIQESVKKIFGKDPHIGINPDEVVAAGASIQGGIFQGDVKDVLLLDVTPLSLGIETLGGVMTKLIEKNTTIPTAKTQIFSTAADNQPSVEIHVLQGEREMADNNKTLGRFILDGLPPAPRGMPQIEVVFDINANGILSVKAKDKATEKEQSIRIEASSDLSKEDIARMKQEAEQHADEDKKKRDNIEIKNAAEQMIYLAEKSLRNSVDSAKGGSASGGKVSEDIKKDIQEKIDNLKAVKDGNDIEAIKSKSQELSSSLQRIGEALYKDKGKDQSAQSGPEEKK
jgi:molecular chaperone DnaK